MPKADAFSIFIQKSLTKFFESFTAIPNDFRDYLHQIWLDIFPSETREIDKWVEQFGLQYYDESTKVETITTQWMAKGGQGKDYIQNILNEAGFNVQIHENIPPVDPDLFLNGIPVMVAGGSNAYAGRTDAFAGFQGGELLVNGPILTNIPLYLSICGNANACCGNNVGHAGYFEKIATYDKIYNITDDSDYWPYFFFIGGDATRDPITKELTVIENVNIPVEREKEFKFLILKLKPGMTWVGLMVNYV